MIAQFAVLRRFKAANINSVAVVGSGFATADEAGVYRDQCIVADNKSYGITGRSLPVFEVVSDLSGRWRATIEAADKE